MSDKIFKHLFYLYFPMTLFEFALVGPAGSILKYLGIGITILWLVIRLVDGEKLFIDNVIISFALWLLFSFISILWSSDKNTGMYYFFAAANMVSLSFVVENIDWQEKDTNRIKLLVELSGAFFGFMIMSRIDLYHGEGIQGIRQVREINFLRYQLLQVW